MSDAMRRKSFVAPPETPSNSSALVDLNDDAQETEQRKRQRRLEKANDTPSILGQSTTSVISVGRAKLAKMTATERLEHTEKCIQLSAANKISAKNAFSLLLIDQMVELVKKEEANFQVASTHLDASAKIYACRVDKVHADVIRFAGGLASNKPRPPVQDEDSDADEAPADGAADGEDGALAAAKAKKKKRRARNVIVKEPKAINGTAHLGAVNIGELYLQHLVTSAEASEPGNCHFLLTLPISGADHKIQLRGEEPAFPPSWPEPPTEAAMSMPDFRACLPKPLLPTEIHRMLVEGDVERSQSRVSPPHTPPRSDHEDDLPNDGFANDDFPRDDFANDDDDDGGDVGGGGGGEDIWTEEVNAGRAGADGGRGNLVAAEGGGRPTHLLTAHDYLTLHRAALGLAAGPRFWKPPRPRPSGVIRPAAAARQRNAAPAELDFTLHDQLFRGFTASTRTQLSEQTVVGWRRATHLLPPSDPDAGKRFQSFWLRNRVTILSVISEGGKGSKVTDNDAAPHVVDLDSSYSNFVGGDSDDEDHGGGGGDGDVSAENMEDAETLNAMAGGGDAAAGLQPLNYAKRAKGIDMRALKRATWEIIQRNLGGKENAGPAHETTLSQIYRQLPARLSAKMAGNLSPALAFMSVLHLANEHNLELRNTPDLTELHVRKTRPDAMDQD